MTKDQLIKILKSLLNTEEDVDFLFGNAGVKMNRVAV